MSYTFLKVKGFKVGKSLVEEEMIEEAELILKKAEEYNTKILLPKQSALKKLVTFCPEKNMHKMNNKMI